MKPTGTKAVALTFDDGPDRTYTPRMLDLLKANGVKATFCLVGKQAKAYPELVRRIVAEGHTLCNHTYDHSLNLASEKRRRDMHSDAASAPTCDAEPRHPRRPHRVAVLPGAGRQLHQAPGDDRRTRWA